MSDFTHLKEWYKLPDKTKIAIFNTTGSSLGLPSYAIEKDWWVVHTIALVFTMECAGSLVFKGGTSLSKGWNLIQRFSEDIDLALDREYLGFTGELEIAEIRRLRRKSNEYITNIFSPELQKKFNETGFKGVTVKNREVKSHDQDPIIMDIYYPKLTEKDEYSKPGVQVEVGSRSLKEPFTDKTFASIVSLQFPGRPFSDKPLTVPVVNPERTFLEKVFLLHEELQRPIERKRVDRLSRHLYDIEKLSNTKYAEVALKGPDLYNTIVAHRRKFNRISGVDFDNHITDKIVFVPPEDVLSDWETDYKQMSESMIYGDALLFDKLIEKLKKLQSRINKIKWD